MNGAALATLFSYVVYFAVTLSVIRIILGVGTFSKEHLKVLAVLAILVLLDLCWSSVVTPFWESLNISVVVAHLIDCIAKTAALGATGVALVYGWKISPEVNDLLTRWFKR
jgi:hypothetical protein